MQLMKTDTEKNQALTKIIECFTENKPLFKESDDILSIVFKYASDLIPNRTKEEPYDIFELWKVFSDTCESLNFDTALKNATKILDIVMDIKINEFSKNIEDYGESIIQRSLKPSVKDIHQYFKRKEMVNDVPKTYLDIILKTRWKRDPIDLLLEISKEIACGGVVKDILESIPASSMANPFRILDRFIKDDYSNESLIHLIKIAEFCYLKMENNKDAELILEDIPLKEDIIGIAGFFIGEKDKCLVDIFGNLATKLGFETNERHQVKQMIPHILKLSLIHI